MRLKSIFPLSRIASAALVMAVAGGLAACGPPKYPDVSDEDLEKIIPGGVPRAVRCPTVEVVRGTQSYPVYQRGRDFDPQYLIYQAGIDDTARECQATAEDITMRVGVSGRVLRGPAGEGTINARLPLRIIVRNVGGEVVYTEEVLVETAIAPGAASAGFSIVQENVIILRMPDDSTLDYRVAVGFVRPANSQ